MFTSNSHAVATPIRNSETDRQLRGITTAWLTILLHWALKAASCLRAREAGHSNTESNTASVPLKSTQSVKSSGGQASCRCARRRCWPLSSRKASSIVAKTVSTPAEVLVSVQATLAPAEEKAKASPKNASQDVAPAATLDFLSRQSPLHNQDEAPMLPMEALHRIVSPAARSVAAAQDTSVPTTPKLLLPEAAFARAAQVTPEVESLIATKRSQRKKTTRVSFQDSAEWVLFDVDQPTVQLVVKSCPTSQEEESPRSPRASLTSSSALSFQRQTSICNQPVCVSSDLETHHSLNDTFREAMIGAATPKARAANPYVLGCCFSSSHATTDDVEPMVATPKAGRMKLPSLGASSDESPFHLPCMTPKTGSSSSTSFGLSDEPQSDDCTTPKAGFACEAQFGIRETLPTGLGDESQTKPDSASSYLHNECEVYPMTLEYKLDLSSVPPAMDTSCQSGSIDKSLNASTECRQASMMDSIDIALEVL